MAKNTTASQPTPDQNETEILPTIEELAKKCNVPEWQMAGLKVANNWGKGKELSEADFLAARDAWLSGPINRG